MKRISKLITEKFDKLFARHKEREAYISTLNHDLKIPTIAQIRALELLISGDMGEINAKQKEILNLTLESCRSMYEMISTISTIYRYENKDVQLIHEKIDLLRLLEEILKKIYPEYQNRKIRIIAKKEEISILGDKLQLNKAFMNLINFCMANALEKTEIIFEIKKDYITNNIFFFISFKNPYLNSKDIENMFKKYTTAGEKLAEVGCSLNLYLAKLILEAHNSNVNFKKGENGYNICNIDLPCGSETGLYC